MVIPQEDIIMEWRGMRRFKQQVSEQECLEVLKKEKRGVLALHGENGYPYALPTNYFYNEEDGLIYFHGAREGNKIDLLKKDNRVSFCVFTQGFQKEGDWAYNPTSVIIRGRITVVRDSEQIRKQCRKLGMKYYPSERSVDEVMRSTSGRVCILALTIDYMTGKLVHES